MEGGSCPAAPESVLAVDFEQWAREHAPRLLRFATLLTGRRELAEDLTQDALLVAYQRWASIGAMENPWAYVVRTWSTGISRPSAAPAARPDGSDSSPHPRQSRLVTASRTAPNSTPPSPDSATASAPSSFCATSTT